MPMEYEQWLVLTQEVLESQGIHIYDVPGYILETLFNQGVYPWNVTDQDWVVDFCEEE